MRSWLIFSSLLLSWICPVYGKVVVFWQEGFPAVETQPLARQTLNEALQNMQPGFASIDEMKLETLKDAELLVLPYGSAFPAETWKTILSYLEQGGNLLNLG